MTAKATIGGLLLVWDPIIERWLLDSDLVLGATDVRTFPETQDDWTPVNGLSEIPEEFKDGRSVEVTFSNKVRVIQHSPSTTYWKYSGVGGRFSPYDGRHVTAYRIPKPYKGGE